jgi:hypothetical protein
VSKLEERSIICEQIQSTPCDTREVAAGRRNFQTAKLKHKIGRIRVFETLTSKEGAGTAPKTDTGTEGERKENGQAKERGGDDKEKERGRGGKEEERTERS